MKQRSDPVASLRQGFPDQEIVPRQLPGGEIIVAWPADRLVAAVQALMQADGPLLLSAITALMDQEGTWLLYHFWTSSGLTLRVSCPSETNQMPSLVPLLPGADWYEREAHDLVGVCFKGHPNLEPLLLSPDWTGPPPLSDTRNAS